MKNTKLIRLICLAIALMLVLSGCGMPQKKIVSYGKQSTSDAIFRYLCCIEKTNYLFEAYGLDSSTASASSLQDNAALWTMTAEDGTSVAENLKKGVMDRLKLMLYLAQYAVDQGYKMDANGKKTMENELNTMVSSFPDKKTFNQTVKTYGVNYDILYDYYMLRGLASVGNYMLFGEGGKLEVSEDSAKNYFNKNYITISCIFINNVNKTYPNGKTVYMPDSEKAEKTALAEEVYNKLLAGEDFSALYQRYSDSQSDSEKETFTKGGFRNAAAEEKAFALSEGETAKIDTDSGIYIIRRLPLDSSFYTEQSEAILTLLETQVQQKLLSDNESGFQMNETLYESVDVAALPFAK